MRDTENDESVHEVCPACGSAHLWRRLYGLPTEETAEMVARDPDLELGGCLISPTSWATKCKECGHEVTLGETMSIFRREPADD
jgi:predicted RNA-binding Zn-ribbon protein involved in translation (DUF1610 family)